MNDATEKPKTPPPAKRVAPWRGRRRVADPKDKFVAVRCTPTQHETLGIDAEKAGLSVGAYLRAKALGSAGPRAVRRPPVERVELARLLGELGKIGSNVNQLAYVANTFESLPAIDALTGIAADVRTMRDELMKVLGRAG